MHTLIITAHPSSKGFTHKIAAAYERGMRSKGATVEILDLYKSPLRQDFFAFENPREPQTGNEQRTEIQQKITDADRLVFVHDSNLISNLSNDSIILNLKLMQSFKLPKQNKMRCVKI